MKNGILTGDQAKAILADLSKSKPAAPDVSTSGGKYLSGVVLTGLVQEQFYNGSTQLDGAPTPINFYTNHLFARRLVLGVKGSLGPSFAGVINYDFAGSYFEQALIQWKQSDQLIIEIGLRKTPFGYDETTSAKEVKSIERSPITNFFTSSNNNRRLGAGSFHEGIYASGTKGDFTYCVAVTNPERSEFGDAGAGPTIIDQRPSAKTNDFAYWGRVFYSKKLEGVTYKIGAESAYLPEQGGNTTAKASGNLSIYGMFADLTVGNFNVSGEYFSSEVKHGRATGKTAKPAGFYLQTAYRFGDFEPVIRFSSLDSDGRGLDISDGVRSAPGGGTMNKLTEWYVGASWYIRGNDLKLQGGYIHAESKETVTGAAAKAKSDGLRTQMQLAF